MPWPPSVFTALPAVTQLLTSGAALNPSSRYAAGGPPARKATGMSRPIDADGTIRFSTPAAFALPADPESSVAADHPVVNAMTQSLIDQFFIFASPIAHTGSNCEISQRPWTFSSVTRTLEVVCVGASL